MPFCWPETSSAFQQVEFTIAPKKPSSAGKHLDSFIKFIMALAELKELLQIQRIYPASIVSLYASIDVIFQEIWFP